MALAEVNAGLGQASARGLDVSPLAERSRARAETAAKYRAAYRQYCWPVRSLADVKLAPFHIMAGERRVHVDKDHLWHMKTIASACTHETLLVPTPHPHRPDERERGDRVVGGADFEARRA
jgi:hypothetical protein